MVWYVERCCPVVVVGGNDLSCLVGGGADDDDVSHPSAYDMHVIQKGNMTDTERRCAGIVFSRLC